MILFSFSGHGLMDLNAYEAYLAGELPEHALEEEQLERALAVVRDLPGPSARGIFRLPVQRSFSSRGQGTVITGVAVSGSLSLGDEIEVAPSGARGRVKAIWIMATNPAVSLPDSRRVRAALDKVGLLHKESDWPLMLSGGEQQRTGIARAIVTDPTLLLCDEPTGDLDRKSGDEILDLLQALNREQGKTIVMVTHDIHAAARASRTLYLNKGRLSTTPVD